VDETSTGGATTVATETGGAAATGGATSTGGAPTGGSATGGTVTGGSATGGAATGGLQATGGTGTGGAATGGLPATGGTSALPAGCTITGTYYAAGTRSSNNSCQSCQPSVSTTAWVSVSDGSSCGSGGVCVSGNCTCSLGALVCGGCLGWNFESGTQSWIKDSDPNNTGYSGGVGNGAQSPTTTNTTVCSSPSCTGSTRALQVGMSMDMQTTREAGISVPICTSGGTTDLSGRTMSVNVFFDGAADFNVMSVLRAHAWGPTGLVQCDLMWGTQMTVGSWVPGSCQFQESLQVTHVAVVVINAGDPWTGTMYLDNVQIN